MNIRLITVLVFVIILIGGLGVFFMNEKNTKELAERITPTIPSTESVNPTSSAILNPVTMQTSDNRVSFTFPGAWDMKDVTPKAGKGEFGTIMQSIIVQSYPIVVLGAQGNMPENSGRVTIEVQNGGSNLSIDQLVDCTGKTISCDKVGIDNEQFIRSETVLNTGVTTITVATFYDDKILKATGTVSTGTDKDMYLATINAILNSFTFSSTSQ